MDQKSIYTSEGHPNIGLDMQRHVNRRYEQHQMSSSPDIVSHVVFCSIIVCSFVFVLFVIALSVLRITVSKYPFGILKHFFYTYYMFIFRENFKRKY